MRGRNERIAGQAFIAAAVIVILTLIADAVKLPLRFAPFFGIALVIDLVVMIIRMMYAGEARSDAPSAPTLPAVPAVARVFITTDDTRWRDPLSFLEAYVRTVLLDDIQLLEQQAGPVMPLNLTPHQASELQELLGEFITLGSFPTGATQLDTGDRVIVVHGDVTSYLLMTAGPIDRVEGIPDIWYELFVII